MNHNDIHEILMTNDSNFDYQLEFGLIDHTHLTKSKSNLGDQIFIEN